MTLPTAPDSMSSSRENTSLRGAMSPDRSTQSPAPVSESFAKALRRASTPSILPAFWILEIKELPRNLSIAIP